MKKYLLIIILLFLPSVVLADGIENYYINATVLDNGDLEVEEYFNLTGSYNGMERIINYRNSYAYQFNPNLDSYGGSTLHNGNGIYIEEVMAVPVDSNFDFNNVYGDIYSLTYSASKGDYKVYTSDNTYDGKSIKIFLPSNKNKAFYIKYRITNMAILHNDIGELGWNIFSDKLTEDIDNLIVTINIPNNKNEIRVWGHGPLNGESEIIDKSTVRVSISSLTHNTAIDVRVVFDKDVISSSNKKSNVSSLDKILKYEENEAEKANYERQILINNEMDEIEAYFKDFYIVKSRYTYNKIYFLINSLPESTNKTILLNRLNIYKEEVDEYEYSIFNDYLNRSFKDYKYYNLAEETIDNVFSGDLQDKMKEELSLTKKKIIVIEWKKERLISLISILLMTLTFLAHKYLYNNKKKVKVDPLYVRDIPYDLPPECAGLLTDSTLNGNEITAALLDLIRRKIITYEKKENGSYDLKFNKMMKEATIKDITLANLIFGYGTTINSKKIKKIRSQDFSKWKKQTIKQLEDNELIKEYNTKKETVNFNLFIYGIVFLLIKEIKLSLIGLTLILFYFIKRYRNKVFFEIFVYINLGLIFASLFINHFIHISIIISIISIIYILIMLKKFPTKLVIKKTEKGKEVANSFNGLRNFLIDFSVISEREIPEIELWEKYLVYATAFGIGKEVLNAMKIRIEAENIDVGILENYAIFNSISDISRITSSISNVSSKAIPVASAKTYLPSVSSSGYSGGSFSSGSGFGGGFSGGSSGGGSFGGGGGGGRF